MRQPGGLRVGVLPAALEYVVVRGGSSAPRPRADVEPSRSSCGLGSHRTDRQSQEHGGSLDDRVSHKSTGSSGTAESPFIPSNSVFSSNGSPVQYGLLLRRRRRSASLSIVSSRFGSYVQSTSGFNSARKRRRYVPSISGAGDFRLISPGRCVCSHYGWTVDRG